MYTHQKKYLTAGSPVSNAGAALIMIHGRGGTAQNIVNLAHELNFPNMAIYAPQATNNSWYPYSFMAPDDDNQPALNLALEAIDELVQQIKADGIPEEKIFFVGFSQGACLTLEYITRNAKQYGGAVAFTGGLIGQQLDLSRYHGDFNQTPVLITTGNPDPHVPLTRVEESALVIKGLNANVTVEVYNGRPHTITQQELELAKGLVFSKIV